MTAQPLPALTSGDPSTWDQALYAFLIEKGNRSGSRRTVESYSRMLWPFFAERSLTPERVKPADVLAWVHGIGKSGRTPSATTVGARIACLSSFYRFLIRMGLVVSNPCDAVERPRPIQSIARGYSADEVRRLLAVVPDTVAGRRDRAILLTLVLTGRRRTEVISLTAADLSLEDRISFYAYRGKGGKTLVRRGQPEPELIGVGYYHPGRAHGPIGLPIERRLIAALGEGHQTAVGPGRQQHSVAIWVVEGRVQPLELDSMPTVGLETTLVRAVGVADELVKGGGLCQRLPGQAVVGYPDIMAAVVVERCQRVVVQTLHRHLDRFGSLGPRQLGLDPIGSI